MELEKDQKNILPTQTEVKEYHDSTVQLQPANNMVCPKTHFECPESSS